MDVWLTNLIDSEKGTLGHKKCKGYPINSHSQGEGEHCRYRVRESVASSLLVYLGLDAPQMGL